MTGSGMLKALGSRSIIGAFNKRLEEVATSSWVSQLALQIDSNVETETIGFLSDTPMMRERQSNLPKKGLRAYTFSITNKDFSAALEVKESDWRRDKTGQIMVRARELGARAAQLPQSVLSSLLVSNGNAYDGVAFYHASGHVTMSGATVANAIQVAAVTGTVPTNAEMELGILSGIENLLGFKDDEGEPRNEFAQSFVVMVPVALWKQASAALRNDFIAAGTSNSIKASGFSIRLVMNPRLTSSVFMYIFREDSDVKGLVWQDEVLPVMESLVTGSEYTIVNGQILFLAKRTGNGGYGRFDQTCRVEFT
jgi:phage major head subunit gpT-like protein